VLAVVTGLLAPCELGLSVGLSANLDGGASGELKLLFGLVVLDSPPLVVVVLLAPKVGSVPNISGGKVDSVAGLSSSDSEGVSVFSSINSLEEPVLSA